MTSPVVNATHDLVVHTDTEDLGLMLEKNSFKTTRANDFSPRMGTGQLTHSDMDSWPTQEFTDWSHGLGVERYADDMAVFLDADGVETAIPNEFSMATIWRESDASFTAYVFRDAGNYTFAGGATSIRYFDPTAGGGAGAWADAKTGLGGSITDMCLYGGKLYAAITGADMQVCADPTGAPTSWAVAHAGSQAKRYRVWEKKMWYSLAADLYNYGGTTWSSAINVGDPSTNVIGLEVQDGVLCVWKEEGLYKSNSDGTAFTAVTTALPRYTMNGRQMKAAIDGWLYFGCLSDVYRVSAVTGSPTMQRITPNHVTDKTFGWGNPVSFHASPKYVYCLFNLAENSYPVLMKYNGDGWHKCWKGAASTTGNTMYYSRISARIFVNNGTTWAQKVTTLNDTPYADYDTSTPATLYFCHHTAKLEEINKSYKDLVVVCENMAAGIYAKFYYQADIDGTWTAFDSTVTVNPQQTIAFISGTTAVAKDMYIKCELYTDSATVTPKVKGVFMRYMPRPVTLYAVTGNVIIDDYQELLDKSQDSLTGGEILTKLRTLSDQATPYQLDTPDDLQHRVVMTNIAWQEWLEAMES